MAVAEAIRGAVIALQIPHMGSTTASHVTVSLGAACALPQADQQPSHLLAIADEQLYAAKAGGRNRANGVTAP